MGLLEKTALRRTLGARERSTRVAEELGFEERVGDGRRS